MKLIKRAQAPTPKFFKVLRNIGLALAAVGGTILAAPIGKNGQIDHLFPV